MNQSIYKIIYLTLALSVVYSNAQTRYEIVVEKVKRAHSNNPKTTALFNLPTTAENSLIGIKIGSGATEDLIVATHHGNEYGSTEVALALIEDLAKSPIGTRTTYVIPVLNISGYNKNERLEEGLDPNRDWDGPCGNAHGTPFKLASITAVKNFIQTKRFVAGVTLHTFSQTVTYPWSFKYNAPTDHDSEFANLAKFASDINKYKTGKTPDLIYTTLGDFESYVFWKHGIWGFLFELGTSHSPTPEEVEDLRKANVPAIRALLSAAPTSPAENHEFAGSCGDAFISSLLTDHGDE